MFNKIPIILSWSGGKDFAYALHTLMQSGQYEVKYLLSTINGNNKRLSMHGVREELIEMQAKQTGIPLLKVYVYESNNEEYERQMEKLLLRVRTEGVDTIAFGDILLEDLRKYREEKNNAVAIKSIFPLWKLSTKNLINDFLKLGFQTITCCVSDEYLTEKHCGRVIDEDFVSALPQTVDPCGENGEYHSFCFAGPIFKNEIRFTKGEIIYRPLELKTSEAIATKGVWYCDLLPVG